MSAGDLLRASVLGVGPYVPGAGTAEVEARHGGRELVRLNWNENLFGPLPGVLEETGAALGSAWVYPVRSYAHLRAEVAAWIGADERQVVPGHGIQALVMAVVSAFVEPGDAVVIPHPTYGLYAQACAAAGAAVHRVQCGASLALDLEAIAAAATSHRAKLAWVCDPNNPTGLTVAPGDWEAFLDALPGGCLVVADEAYHEYVEPERRIDRLADVRAGRPVLVLRTFSKIFGLAGLRLGYMLLAPDLAGHIDTVLEPFNVNLAALVAGLASLRRVDQLPERREQVARARRALVGPLADAGVRTLESEANFVLLELGVDDLRVTDALARDGVLVRPGSEFGLPGFVRVTTAGEELMAQVAGWLLSAARP